MKSKISFIFIIIFLFLFQVQAYAGEWLNVDLSNYRKWVDTSHYEYKQYSQWVSDGYWQDESYWTGEYWVYNPAGRDTIAWGGDLPPWSQWGYAFFSLPSYFVNRLSNSGDIRAVLYRNDTTTWTGAHGPNAGYKYNKRFDVTYDYSWDTSAPRILRRPWHLYLEKEGPWYDEDMYLYAESGGYNRKDYIYKTKWIDTSHWEYPWGNVWVVSGYWDESHGTVSLSKSPRYVFTKLTEQNDGDVMHMDMDVSWAMNKNVTKVEAYHDVNRYRNKGVERIYGSNLKINGLNTPNGSGTYRFEYNHPGDPDSLLYVEFTFENGTKVRVYAKIPINGIATTEKLSSPDPVFDKSLMDADSVSF